MKNYNSIFSVCVILFCFNCKTCHKKEAKFDDLSTIQEVDHNQIFAALHKAAPHRVQLIAIATQMLPVLQAIRPTIPTAVKARSIQIYLNACIDRLENMAKNMQNHPVVVDDWIARIISKDISVAPTPRIAAFINYFDKKRFIPGPDYYSDIWHIACNMSDSSGLMRELHSKMWLLVREKDKIRRIAHNIDNTAFRPDPRA